ncbi:uncharacterized protein EDB91DRAFT_1084112 [Suillus paluster]|uniref:uncharacterized protein n=1 Tax=Suillus paluster TaxID=48578 RepID=UPI001B87CFEC|nr:uncharacterized protein EDB91DRAFT_1084112 [Suillus paluster]KAG1734202.1 hypothetical protein EDB91DRAFT_1084112 [Suillus paluster]
MELKSNTHCDRALTNDRPMSPTAKATCKDEKIGVKRPKLEAPNAEPMYLLPPFRQCEVPDARQREVPDARQREARQCEVPDAEPMYPLPPFRQTPGPISCWEAELKACQKAKQLQLLEIVPAGGMPGHARLVTDRWDAEAKRCEEAKRVQLLEILLAAHGIRRLA